MEVSKANKEEDGDSKEEGEGEGEEEDGIEFFEALSDRGDQEVTQEARDLMTTKVRLFGESQNTDDDEDGSSDKNSEESEGGILELAEGEDPAQFIDYLRSQLKAFRKAYQCQVLSSMRIIKKLRTVHMDNKRLQAILSMEREQARLANLA